MIQQVSQASLEYTATEDEFEKVGFHKMAASIVRPPLVKESKIKMECRVSEVKSLGVNGGAGQLVIAEIVCMHVADDLSVAMAGSINSN